MKSKVLLFAIVISLVPIVALVISVFAGTQLRTQDLPPSPSFASVDVGGLTIYGAKTNAEIQVMTCAAGVGRCMVSSTDEGDFYLNFGTGAGQFRSQRTGKLP